MEEPGTTQRGHGQELVEEALAGLAMLLIRGVKASPDPAAAAQVAGAGLRALGDWIEQTAADVAGKDAVAGAGLVEWPPEPQGGAAEMDPAGRQPFLLIDDEDHDEEEAADAAVAREAAAGPVDSGTVAGAAAAAAEVAAAFAAADLPVPEKDVPVPVAASGLEAAADPSAAAGPVEGEESANAAVMEAAFPLAAAVPVSGVVPDAPGLAPFPMAAVLGEAGGADPEARAVPEPGIAASASASAQGVAWSGAVVSGAEDSRVVESPAAAPEAEAAAAELSSVAVPSMAVPVLEKLPAVAGPRVSGEWVTSPVPLEVPEDPSVRPFSGLVRMLIWLGVLVGLVWGLRALVQHFFSALFSA